MTSLTPGSLHRTSNATRGKTISGDIIDDVHLACVEAGFQLRERNIQFKRSGLTIRHIDLGSLTKGVS
jgi:hypothetical protein